MIIESGFFKGNSVFILQSNFYQKNLIFRAIEQNAQKTASVVIDFILKNNEVGLYHSEIMKVLAIMLDQERINPVFFNFFDRPNIINLA